MRRIRKLDIPDFVLKSSLLIFTSSFNSSLSRHKIPLNDKQAPI